MWRLWCLRYIILCKLVSNSKTTYSMLTSPPVPFHIVTGSPLKLFPVSRSILNCWIAGKTCQACEPCTHTEPSSSQNRLVS